METLEKLVAYRQELTRKIKELQVDLDEINEEVLAVLKDNGKYEVGDYVVTVGETRRFDKELAKQVLQDDQLRQVSDLEVNGAKLKALYPDDYEFCQKVYGKRLTISGGK
jgi:regulator of replication initiation timing